MDFRAFIVAPRLRHLYELLQLELGATTDQVTRAYRRFALLYHPDKIGSTPENLQLFHDLQDAYATLTDPEKIKLINEDYYASLPTQLEVGNRVFDIGAFFGMRFFRREEHRYHRSGGRVRALLTTTAAPLADPYAVFFSDDGFEGETSILDHPDWDLLEIMMAGTMSEEQLRIVEEIYHQKGLAGATETPWFLQNMEGFYHFSRRDFRRAMETFEELNRAIPHNIIFMYRLGLSCEALYAHAREEGWVAYSASDRLLRKAAGLYESAIRLGHLRPGDEYQHCFTILKALADLYEAVGERGKSRAIWARIIREKKKSLEAAASLRRLSLWRSLFRFRVATRPVKRLTTDDR